MTTFHLLAAGTLAAVAVLHSVLGEVAILRPLLADDRWRLGPPRWAVERILRFAWHLTSIAWVALAAVTLGADGPVVVAVTAAVSGLLILAMLPAHLAWPLFLAIALWAGVAAELVGPVVLRALTLTAVVVATLAALLHLGWAGGRAKPLARAAVPTRPDGRPLFEPSAAATLAVAAALVVFAGALAVALVQPVPLARWLVAAGTAVLVVRAVGDGRYAGFSKRLRSTAFARRDDLVYTPIVVSLAFGGLAVLAS